MLKILNIYKPLGLTPLQLIEKLRKEKPEFKNIKIGFAGRLDPLAAGVMLLMIGEETKNRAKYLGLDKEYEFEVLLGAATDTYDVLGFLQNKKIKPTSPYLEKQIEQFVKEKIGKHMQQYPAYSSKEIQGKPLFKWARENRLSEIKIPKKEIAIYSFGLLGIKQIPSEKIREQIIKNINRVSGDFRQEEILKKWDEFFKKNNVQKFTVAKFRISCSSGTYVRSLANEMGKELNCGALALSITRTRVGEYTLKNTTEDDPVRF